MSQSFISMFAGDRFGRLVVLEDRQRGERKVKCRCDCGTEKMVGASHIATGRTLSCGCLMRETTQRIGSANERHGHWRGQRASRTYKSWEAMVRRCTVPTSSDWNRYGGAGVIVCERWLSFEAFLADMGERPEERTLDRIDPYGNYEPHQLPMGNCS